MLFIAGVTEPRTVVMHVASAGWCHLLVLPIIRATWKQAGRDGSGWSRLLKGTSVRSSGKQEVL